MKSFPRFFYRPTVFALLAFSFLGAGAPAEKPVFIQVGAAAVDITPDYPIRLSGYGGRLKESEGIDQHLFAKALAIGSDREGPAVFFTVDNLAVPDYLRTEVINRLASRAHIRNERVAICSTHTHTAPMLKNVIANLFGADIPPDQQERIDRYTRELTDKLEQVALAALRDRQPATLAWGLTRAGFAANRRTNGGPVDHDVPVLTARDKSGKLRALLVNYACHCTTLSDAPNYLCGDWAGYAQEYLERDHPGAVALVAIGCGGDANPTPRTGLELARQHGQTISAVVNELLARTLTPINQKLECRTKAISLPFDTLPTRAEWERFAQSQNHWIAYHAKRDLARLDRGEQLPTQLPYLVQTWNFGGQLAMIFLPGEVVVDYSLRLKQEFDASRLWVNAYANDVPCYIPSRRIWREGGYEGGGAMIYYDRPTRLAEGTEERIIAAVHELMPKTFAADESKLEFPPPKSPRDSLAAMQTKAGLQIDLVASEPLIVDPVAIDWGPDGKLWVVEMRDYPSGMDGNWKPGSRIKYLEDTHHDGKYDKATVFLDNLPFATGVTAWRKGALVCAAPDIIYAEDTNGDGRADLVKKIFTGFFTDNYQARVNSLSLGLDNWIYGANGLLGGVIRGTASGLVEAGVSPRYPSLISASATPGASVEVDIRGRDFRMNPETGAFEPASGLTQQGRVRDDWGNWFGCDNSTIAWHYPIPDHYIRRNPHVPAPSPRVSVAAGNDPNLLRPISHTLERFNEPKSANRVTSGCGLGLYRDELLGREFQGNAFLCEPVHNLVHRLVVQPKGVTFSGVRAGDEQQSEFLASHDNWFRPVQARTGPDGALWVVDMYRFVIEHPRWIPPERLAQLDVRAGEDKGRIYRVYPRGAKLRPIPNLTKLPVAELAAALDNPNGTERDRIHQELLCRQDFAAVPPLEKLAAKSRLPEVRLQALCVLAGLHKLKPSLIQAALADSNPGVRAHALRLAEPMLNESDTLLQSSLGLLSDPELSVRFQLALSLGESRDPRAGPALGGLAARDLENVWLRAAVLSSAMRQPADILKPIMALDAKRPGRSEMVSQLIATSAGEGSPESIGKVIAAIAPAEKDAIESWQFGALASLLDALDRKNLPLGALATNDNAQVRQAITRLEAVFDAARLSTRDQKTTDDAIEPAIRLLGRRVDSRQDEDLRALVALLAPTVSPRLQTAALETLKHNRSGQVAALVLSDWKLRSPGLRQSIIDLLLAREEWVKELLAALESGSVARNEISTAHRQRLLRSINREISPRAQALWPANPSGNRAEVLAKFQSATQLSGDAARGATVFGNLCATCHFLRGQGHNVGPSLAPLADKTPADFLAAILDPNAAVEPRFVAYNIETKDNRSLNGIVSAETATTLTLVQGGGAQEKILRGEIQEIRASGISLMPEGLEQSLTPESLADLIAFLKTSPRPFGSATAEQAAAAKKAFLAAGANGLDRLDSAFDQLPYPSWMGSLIMPYCRQTDGKSKLAWQTAKVPEDLKPGESYVFRAAAGMGFSSDRSGKFELRLNGKTMLEFDVALADQVWQSSDAKVRMAYTVMENNAEDSNGVLTIEVASALLEPGKPATFEVIGSAAGSQRWFGLYQVMPVVRAGQ